MDIPYRHIACCVDDSPASMRAIAEARRLRALGPGRLTLLHVAQLPVMYGPWMPNPADVFDGARRWLRGVVDEIPEADAILVEGGHAPAEACAWAQRQAVDLLVCASHRGPMARSVLGSFANHLVHHAPCPVLVVRPGVADEPAHTPFHAVTVGSS